MYIVNISYEQHNSKLIRFPLSMDKLFLFNIHVLWFIIHTIQPGLMHLNQNSYDILFSVIWLFNSREHIPKSYHLYLYLINFWVQYKKDIKHITCRPGDVTDTVTTAPALRVSLQGCNWKCIWGYPLFIFSSFPTWRFPFWSAVSTRYRLSQMFCQMYALYNKI